MMISDSFVPFCFSVEGSAVSSNAVPAVQLTTQTQVTQLDTTTAEDPVPLWSEQAPGGNADAAPPPAYEAAPPPAYNQADAPPAYGDVANS